MNNKPLYPQYLFKCPTCGGNSGKGFELENDHCHNCGTTYFSLGNIPCLFPSGILHKHIWQHQTATMKNAGMQALMSIQESLSRYDVSETTRIRLAEALTVSETNLNSILHLLNESGIEANHKEEFNQINVGDFNEYFEFILRDWGWDTVENPSMENSAAIDRIMQLIETFPEKPKRVLVLGAGAGRLSWDLHTRLKPTYTIALDSNPLLLAVANRLIREQKTLTFGEFKQFPQINFPTSQLCTLEPPKDPENLRERWFALGANIWQIPLNQKCFDLIVTPWFIDVNGGDLRNLIGIISQSLEDGGHWLNSGPLLFSNNLPVQLKYTALEIKEFIALSGFTLTTENVEQAGHLLSPLEARFKQEQLWTFSARKTPSVIAPSMTYIPEAWLVMHHLPVPQITFINKDKHPLIDIILLLVDGNRSINDICVEILQYIPKGISVEDVVVTLFGQMLTNTIGEELSLR